MFLESPFELVHKCLIQYPSIGTLVIPCCGIAQYIWCIGKGRSTLADGYVTPGVVRIYSLLSTRGVSIVFACVC